MGEQDRTDERMDAVRDQADEDVPDEAEGVVSGPEGAGGAAGRLAPHGGVSGGGANEDA
jgi:hypothetical protein